MLESLKYLIRSAYWAIKRPVVEFEGIKIPIGPYLSVDMQHELVYGAYETVELNLVSEKLEASDRVMELGTGIGLISSYCAKKIGSDRVFTFEPNPGMEKPIRRVYELNQVSPTLTMCLLGEESGEQVFYVDKDFWTSTSVQGNRRTRPITVPVKSFNEEIKRIDPTFLIMDIEGGEYDLMKYADLHHVRKIMIEIHPLIIGEKKAGQVKDSLVGKGFTASQPVPGRNEYFFEKQE